MQTYVNEDFLEQRRKFAKWGSYVGFGSLLIGLITTSNNPLLSYAFLLVGLLGATFGSYISGRYLKEPRADTVFQEAGTGLDKRHALYCYYLDSHYVIASHHGLTVLEPKPQVGEISYDNGHWKHKSGFRKIMQLFGEPALGKPDRDLSREIEWTKEWIDALMPEDDIPVNGAVVFINSGVTLHVSNASVPIIAADDLVAHMKQGLKGSPILTTAKQKELRRVLDEVVSQS